MSNPFQKSRWFHRIGHVTNTMPLRMMTPTGVAIVTTTGRKSGKQRSRAMRAVRDADRVYAVALLGPSCDWIANIRANPTVSIKLGSKTHRATARVLASADDLAHGAASYRPVAGWYDYFDYANFMWSLPTKARLLRAHDEWFASGTPVVFEIADAS